MKQRLWLWAGCFWLTSCMHPSVSSDAARPLPQPFLQSEVAVWMEYTNNLEALTPKDLKNECDRLKKLSDRGWADELRCALASSLQAQKARNFQKASETLAQASGKIPVHSELRAWLKLYGQQVNALALLDKELTEEKRLRIELEKKVKALSDIERDISERSKNADLIRP